MTDAAPDIGALMTQLGGAARAARPALAAASTAQKNAALSAASRSMRTQSAAILAANDEDMARARANGASRPRCSIAYGSMQRASRQWRAGSTKSPRCPIRSAA